MDKLIQDVALYTYIRITMRKASPEGCRFNGKRPVTSSLYLSRDHGNRDRHFRARTRLWNELDFVQRFQSVKSSRSN